MESNVVIPYLATQNPKQILFHASDAPFRSIVGGWGCGKSTSLIHDIWMQCQPFPGCTALVGRKTYRELNDTTWKMALAEIPRPMIKKVSKEHMTITLQNQVEILFRSMEDPDKLRSLNLGYFALDEAQEMEREYWDMLVTRLRQPNSPRKGILAANYHGHNWVWKLFKRAEDPTRYALIESSTFDNAANLPPDFLEKLKDLPKDQYKRNVQGSFDDFEGQVFTEYDERAHVLDFALNPAWEFKRAVDPGLDHPTACLWYGVDKEGRVFVFDEYSHSDCSAETNARAIIAKTHRHKVANEHGTGESPIAIRLTVIDPSSLQRQSTSMKTVFMEYGLAGIRPLICAARTSRELGMMRIQEYLRLRSTSTHPTYGIRPSPKMFIHPRCKQLLEQVTNFTWDDYGKKKNDDLVDALKYALTMESHPGHIREAMAVPEYVPENPLTGYAWIGFILGALSCAMM